MDLVAANLREIVEALCSGQLTTEYLVREYFHRIERDNHRGLHLRAIIERAPKDQVLSQARVLDDERRSGHIRGTFHGVPIIVKDSIYTDPILGMQTTGGTVALLGSVVPCSAPVVDHLLAAGAIIIGKANMTVLGNLYGSDTVSGWSPRGGQTLSPYTLDRMTSGSSSGSAVGLAAGFCAASIGGETQGSIIWPASNAGLFALKPSSGLVSTDGVISISFRQDVLGPMGKSAWDVAATLSAMVGDHHDFTAFTTRPYEEISRYSLGVTNWNLKEDDRTKISEEVHIHFNKVVGLLGTSITANLQLEELNDNSDAGDFVEGKWEGQKRLFLIISDLREAINHHLAKIENSNIKTIEDLVSWNEENPTLAFGSVPTEHSQKWLRLSSQSEGNRTEAYSSTLNWFTAYGCRVEQVMIDKGLDAILFPAYTAGASALSASIGLPMATVPIGQLSNGCPVGLWIMAKRGDDKTLLGIMAALEAALPPRPLPDALRKDMLH